MHASAVSTSRESRPAPTDAPDPAAWSTVLALAAGAFALGTDLFVVAALLPGVAADVGVSVGTAGLVVTVFAVAHATGAPLFSVLLGGWRLKAVLVGSLALFGLCTAASALAPTFAVLLGTRVLSALAASVYVPAAGAAAVAAVPADYRGRALALLVGGASVATAVGAPLGAWAAAAGSWRAAFGLVALVAAVSSVALLRSSAGAGSLPRSTLRQRLAPMRSPAVVATLTVTLLMTAGSHAMYTYLDVLLGSTAQPGGLGSFLVAFGVGGLLGTWCGGRVVDRWGSQPVVRMAAAAFAAVGVTVPVWTSGPTVAAAILLGWGVAAFAIVPAQQHRLIGLHAGPAPVVLALNSSAVHLGFASGALAGGIVLQAAGPDQLGLLAVACCGAGLAVHTLFTTRTKEREQ